MAKMSIGQKAARVLAFLMGLRNPQVAASLSAHGFRDEDLAEGWSKLVALTQDRLEVSVPAPLDPASLISLDTWENKWLPIAKASLRNRFTDIYEIVFRNLTQTEGAEVILSVGTFLRRLEELKSTPRGKEALTLLAQRGIGDSVIAEAKVLLKKLETVDKNAATKQTVTPEEEALREIALWNWYREWGDIARTVITDRRQLKALGFLDDNGHASTDTEDRAEDVAPTPAKAETPATPAKPFIVGMRGGSPFIDEP